MIDPSVFLRAAAELSKRQLQEICGALPSDSFKDPTEGMTDAERKDYVSQVSVFFPLIEKHILRLISQQVDFIARDSESFEQVLFARGNINFADVLLEQFKALRAEHQETILKSQGNPTQEPVPPLEGGVLHG